tara:strand:+ start:1938 stop:2048 length:111 start_codon:yes stop_codon:yes gene_type:complete
MLPEQWSLELPVTEAKQFTSFLSLKTPKKPKIIDSL